jgi:hypothetical protein
MDRAEARKLLDQEMATLRELGYEGLRARVPLIVRRSTRRFLWWRYEAQTLASPPFEVHDVTADSGTVYQVETDVNWDEDVDGSIRVLATIDDGGDSSMTDGFVMAPDGRLVGNETWEGS